MSRADFRHDRAGTPSATWTQVLAAHDVAPLRLPAHGRLIVFAAHPDDETLGAGGLINSASRARWPIQIISATAGEGSHPRSPTHTPQVLAQLRARELIEAIARLAPDADVACLGLPDGSLRDRVEELVAELVALIGVDGDAVLLCAPWRSDGHPDHEAAGVAAAIAADRTGARLLEYPVWTWHWGQEDDLPWPDARSVRLDAQSRAAKDSAIAAHATQVEPLSPEPGDEVLLDASLLAHFRRDVEILFEDQGPITDDALDRVHRERPDPWQVDSFYERRKRSITLASLPRERYGRALEVGCSVGALAVDLAARSEHLLAIDSSERAVAKALDRTRELDHVDVRRCAVPKQWPSDRFDLISISEIGYFLSPRQLSLVIEHSLASLSNEGHLLLCHWRHQPVGWPMAGPAVHEAFLATGAAVLVEHQEPDFLLHVLERP